MFLTVRPLSNSLTFDPSERGDDFLCISFRAAVDSSRSNGELRVVVNCHFFRISETSFNSTSISDEVFGHPDLALPPRIQDISLSRRDPVVIDCTNNRPRMWAVDNLKPYWGIVGYINPTTLISERQHRFALMFNRENNFSHSIIEHD